MIAFVLKSFCLDADASVIDRVRIAYYHYRKRSFPPSTVPICTMVVTEQISKSVIKCLVVALTCAYVTWNKKRLMDHHQLWNTLLHIIGT